MKGMKTLKHIILLLLFTVTVVITANPLDSYPGVAPPPVIEAKSAVLMDYITGEVLYQQNAHLPHPPASLTKIMTLHLVYKEIERGNLKLNDTVKIPPSAWAVNMPEGSSLMFLGPNQETTILELMQGVGVVSGNDAAVALAQIVAGDVDRFVAMMNREAQSMGYTNMYFADPSGLNANSRITAFEFARFCRNYIKMHQDSLKDIHSLRTFSYPEQKNLINGAKDVPITQYNRNRLLWRLDYVDGLKTGYIDKSGYNIALTAVNNGMRLIAVILGVEGSNHSDGYEKLAKNGEELLSWGFDNFETLYPENIVFKNVPVWKGEKDFIAIKPEREVVVTVAKSEVSSLSTTIVTEEVIAPVERGEVLGRLTVKSEDRIIETFDLVAEEDVSKAGLLKSIWHTLVLFTSGILQR